MKTIERPSAAGVRTDGDDESAAGELVQDLLTPDGLLG
jgi:hypothetical protein